MNLKSGIKLAIASILAVCTFSTAEEYIVQKGDTIQKIAKKFGVSEEEIIKANNITDPKKLRDGQKLIIPAKHSSQTAEKKTTRGQKEEVYEVKSGDTLEKIAKKYGISVKDIMDYNDMRDEKIFAGDQLKIPLSRKAMKRKREEEARKKVDLSRCEIYTLQRGGTLKHVSRRTGVDVDTLERLNSIDRSVWLEAGTKVCLGERRVVEEKTPAGECELFYRPKERVSVSEVARKFGIPKERLKELNSIKGEYINRGQEVCVQFPEERQPSRTKTENFISYRVKRGDTLEKISQKFGVPEQTIREVNNLKSSKLHAGTELKIPSSTQSIKPEEKLKDERPKEDTPQTTAKVALPKEVKQKNGEEPAQSTNGVRLSWPVRGTVVANFQNDDNVRHLGIDISSSCNEKVLAAESGKVIYAGDSIKAFGNLVVIRHDNGLTTVYGYLDRISVSEGSRVSKGEEIGRAGRLKNSDSCGIYFEVRKNVTPIDPLKVLD